MQDARRAGAGSVHFEFDAGGNTLSITDDGCGIADFRALITLAGLDWSQEVMDAERPFGIGFFSVCFAADGVLAQSLGKGIHFSAGDLIEKRPIAVKTSDFIGGTRIQQRTEVARLAEVGLTRVSIAQKLNLGEASAYRILAEAKGSKSKAYQ